jgi:hypothetical protein
MASIHAATPTFCIEPSLKEAVRTAAVNGHQSIANMIEGMIRDYCGRVGVEIAEPQALHVNAAVTQVRTISHTPLRSPP